MYNYSNVHTIIIIIKPALYAVLYKYSGDESVNPNMFINEIDTWIAVNGVTANQQQVMALHLTGAAKERYYNETMVHHARPGISVDRVASSASASNNRYYKNHV